MRKRFIALAAFVVLLTSGLLWASESSATPQQDGAFLYALGEAGIGYEDSSVAIKAGKAVCRALDAGASPQDIVRSIDQSTQLNERGASLFVAISVAAFCQQSHGDILLKRPAGTPVRL